MNYPGSMVSAPASRNALLTLATGVLLAACSGPKGSDKVAGSPGKEPATDATAATSAAATKVSQINVFVDMSGGMQGFVHPVAPGASGSGFQQTVTELLSDVNAQRAKQTGAPAYYFFKEGTAADPRLLVPSSYNEMTSTVSGGLKNAARGSELPQMLSEALKLQAKKPGTVSVLISDFIFAPKATGETWKIKTFIKDALSAVEPGKLGVSVFANTSDYRGNFYPGNRSGAQKLNGEKIPYYIWVLGDPALVAQLDAGLLRKLAAQPQAHYNVRFAPPYMVPDFLVDPVGRWSVTTGEAGAAPLVTFQQKPTVGKPAEIMVALDLSKLPASQTSLVSAKTLRLAETDGGATLTKVLPLAQMPDAKRQPVLNKYTHFAQLRFVQAPPTPTDLHLELARTEPAWIAAYSIDDDRTGDSNIKSKGAKTFHLTEVLRGVADYFADEPSAQRVFSVPVRVETRD